MTTSFVYHYTTGHKLPLIQQYGALTPTSVAIAPKEKPVLWFSTNTDYEPTAIKLIVSEGRAVRPTPKELHDVVGLYRFRLPADDARLIPFSKLQRIARISHQGMAQMIQSGLKIGATPKHWYGVMSDVELSDVIVERWTGEAWIWVPVTLAEAVDNFRNNGPTVQSVSAGRLGMPVTY